MHPQWVSEIKSFLPGLKELRRVRKMGQWTITLQPGKCFDSRWHMRHVFVLYLAQSGQRAFLTEGMPSRARKYQRICCVSGTANDSLPGWTYCSHENNLNSFNKEGVIMSLSDNVASLLEIFPWFSKIKRIKFNMAIKIL